MVSIIQRDLKAKINVDALNRPSGVLGQLYDFIKNRIDTYLN